MRCFVLVSALISLSAWSADSPSAHCTSPSSSGCGDQPDLIQCGDYYGFGRLDVLLGKADAGRDSFDLPTNTPLYPSTNCRGEKSEQLSRCYYDEVPHGSKKSKYWHTVEEFHALQSEYVSLFTVTRTAKDCSKAGIPDAKGAQPFCAALINCMGSQTQFHVCKAAADGACPPAEECMNEKSFDQSPDPSGSQPESLNGQVEFLPSGRPLIADYTKITLPGTSPLIVKDAAGHAQCFEVLQKNQKVTGTDISSEDKTTYDVLSAPVDENGGCGKLKRVYGDECVVPHNQVSIRSYSGSMIYSPKTNSGIGSASTGDAQ